MDLDIEHFGTRLFNYISFEVYLNGFMSINSTLSLSMNNHVCQRIPLSILFTHLASLAAPSGLLLRSPHYRKPALRRFNSQKHLQRLPLHDVTNSCEFSLQTEFWKYVFKDYCVVY